MHNLGTICFISIPKQYRLRYSPSHAAFKLFLHYNDHCCNSCTHNSSSSGRIHYTPTPRCTFFGSSTFSFLQTSPSSSRISSQARSTLLLDWRRTGTNWKIQGIHSTSRIHLKRKMERFPY